MRILTLLLTITLLNGCIVLPISEVYIPRIEGVVIDDNYNPIEGAKVTRIENKSVKDSDEISTSIQVLTDTVLTDISGSFVLNSKSKVTWLHGGIQSSVFLCYGNFEVTHDEYSKYESQPGEYERETDRSDMCNDVKFETKIVLNKSN